ncbi:MAG: ribonuclease Z [Flavobacteriales bacterium]
MTFEITILGCGAATPTGRHNPSAQVVNVHDKLFLVDCGEGTQMQMRKYKVRMQRINHVFISHLHGDHYLGLMGFISSMHLLGRKAALHIYGPPELKEIIDLSLRASQTYLEYALVFHPTDDGGKQLIYEDKTLSVFSIPLKHRIFCCGFLFVEKQRQPKVRKESIEELGLIPGQILALKKGQDIEIEGKIWRNDALCTAPPPPRSYAYCSDTASSETVISNLQGTSCLYHESTFLEEEKKRAKETFHSTAKQAARVASAIEANMLILGHFSSRYSDDEAFRQEASEFFANSILADEGLLVRVNEV